MKHMIAASISWKYNPECDRKKLPNWVVNEIENARVIGNSKQTVILPDGRKYQLNNTLNHMSGGEWTYFINSVINTAYKTSGEDSFAHKIRKIPPTPKPPQLMRDIIQFFTKENELVFDYFMGVGGTLLGAGVCNRKAIGIDLNPDYIDAYKRAAKEIGVPIYIAEEELQPLVSAWRNANPMITRLWWDIDRAVKTCVKERCAIETHGLKFHYQSGFLFLTFPSGRQLAYVKPRIGENQFGGEVVTYEGVGATKKWERLESYGPNFTENAVQAIARDIIMFAIQTLSR